MHKSLPVINKTKKEKDKKKRLLDIYEYTTKLALGLLFILHQNVNNWITVIHFLNIKLTANFTHI